VTVVRWSLDRLSLRSGALICQGWCAAQGHTALQLVLSIRFEGGESRTVSTSAQLARQDVFAAHPELGEFTGFLMAADMPHAPAVSAQLQIIDAGGSGAVLLNCDVSSLVLSERQVTNHRVSKRLAQAWQHITTGHLLAALAVVWTAAMRWYAQRTKRHDVLAFNLETASNFALVIDHQLGGGANQYRHSLLNNMHAQGTAMLLWTFDVNGLVDQLWWHAKGEGAVLIAQGQAVDAQLAHLLALPHWQELYFNDAVSFAKPLRVPKYLQAAAAAGKRVTMLMHDFHAVCPSHFLINRSGQFCGVQQPDVCAQCWPHDQEWIARLYQGDLVTWRQAWGQALHAAHEVRFFSENTRRTLLKAYPELALNSTSVMPHVVPAISGAWRAPQAQPELVIGVVGHIGRHKGSAQIEQIAKWMAAEKREARVVVVGSIDGIVHPLITCTGSYRREDLADLLAKHNVGVVWMPSICAETFSYVMHELLALRAPVVTFDLGAQADLAHAYALGAVTPLQASPAQWFEALQTTADRAALSSSAA
jgi:glycosyltransferase involved in cell wall biosynthesis